MFNLIATVNADNAEIVEFCAHEIELLDNRKGHKGMTTTQKANIVLMDTILDGLFEMNKPVTVTELIKGYAPLTEYTNQKITALLRKMCEDNRVVKTIEKKKAFYAVA